MPVLPARRPGVLTNSGAPSRGDTHWSAPRRRPPAEPGRHGGCRVAHLARGGRPPHGREVVTLAIASSIRSGGTAAANARRVAVPSGEISVPPRIGTCSWPACLDHAHDGRSEVAADRQRRRVARVRSQIERHRQRGACQVEPVHAGQTALQRRVVVGAGMARHPYRRARVRRRRRGGAAGAAALGSVCAAHRAHRFDRRPAQRHGVARSRGRRLRTRLERQTRAARARGHPGLHVRAQHAPPCPPCSQ